MNSKLKITLKANGFSHGNTVMFWISERKLHQIAPEPSDPGGQIRTFSSLSPPQWPSYSPVHTKTGNLRPQHETFFLTLPSLTDVLSNKDSIVHYYDEFPWWLIWWRICLQCRRPGFDPWIRKIPWRRKWQPTPVFLPGKSHGRRSLEGYSSKSRKESDTTERQTLSPYTTT